MKKNQQNVQNNVQKHRYIQNLYLFYVFESSNWEQYEIVFLKILANQKWHAGKDGPLQRTGMYWFENPLI